MIRQLLLTTILLSTPAWAAEPLDAGEASAWQRYQLRNVNANMDEAEYRKASRKNQKQIRHFIQDYSESSLTSLGIPRSGVRLLGAVAGAAITQDATFYVNKSKFLALGIKDAAENDRSIFLGFKIDW